MQKIDEKRVLKLSCIYQDEYNIYTDDYFSGIVRGTFLSEREFILKNYY